MSRAIVLFSGGKDSTVALAWTLARFDDVVALSFDVPFRPRQERRAAVAIAGAMQVRLEVIQLPFMRDVATLAQSDGASARQTAGAYVPARNLVYHSVAIHLASSWSAESVIAGHVRSDGDAYADAEAAYLHSIYSLAAAGHDGYGAARPPQLVLPFAQMADRSVVALGKTLGAPLDESWSCLEDGPTPCGACVSCRDRNNALEAA